MLPKLQTMLNYYLHKTEDEKVETEKKNILAKCNQHYLETKSAAVKFLRQPANLTAREGRPRAVMQCYVLNYQVLVFLQYLD